jgi:acetyltransferase-like isoleucine patch superfamily enzyme
MTVLETLDKQTWLQQSMKFIKKIKDHLKIMIARRLQQLELDLITYEKNLLVFKSFGQDVKLNGKITFTAPENIEIENNVHIGDNAYIDSKGGVFIGENTHISRNFVLYSSNHNYHGDCLPYDSTHILKSVRIGRNVWIGINVIVIPGVSIGDVVIIGAGTVVSKDVPDLAIVGSQPFRILKHRDKEHYNSLDKSELYGGVNGRKIDPRKC